MRLLLTGDWHIRETRPEKRTDDYWMTMIRKLGFIMSLAQEENCSLILQPGDFFDSHKANDFLKRYMIKKLKWKKIKVLTVFGQHDLRYHSSNVKNTPLGVLYAAGVVRVLSNIPADFSMMNVYGTNWYEEIPTVMENPDTVNILVAHKMVIANEKVWDGQEDYSLGNILLRTLPYDLMVFGDNHQSFVISKGDRHLVNCGSLLRSNIDQIHHVPIVYIYDTETKELVPNTVPCELFDKVFDMTKVEAEKEKNEKMEAFVNRVTKGAKVEGLDFIKNLHTFVERNKEEIDDDTQAILDEVMA